MVITTTCNATGLFLGLFLSFLIAATWFVQRRHDPKHAKVVSWPGLRNKEGNTFMEGNTSSVERRRLALTVTNDQKRRLKEQNRIGYPWPWYRVELVGTHNSYNTDMDGYPYPNHEASLAKQLRAGLHLVNFDVHDKSYGLVLCHAWKLSWNCRTSDRNLKEGLRDIKRYLDDNPDDFVVLVIESNDQYNGIGDDLDQVFGSLLFKPKDDPLNSCEFPMTGSEYTRKELMNKGHQVVAVRNVLNDGDCDMNSKFFRHIFKLPIVSDKGGETAMEENRDPNEALIYKTGQHFAVWEDRYEGGNKDESTIARGKEELEKIQKRNGYNQIGLDFALRYDSRFEQLIWSWGPDEPNNANGRCAAIARQNYWHAANCDKYFRAVCREEKISNNNVRKYSTWKLSANEVSFENAWDACTNLNGGDWKFEPPINAYEHYQVLELRETNDYYDDIWVNHYRESGTTWGFVEESV